MSKLKDTQQKEIENLKSLVKEEKIKAEGIQFNLEKKQDFEKKYKLIENELFMYK